MVKRVADVPGRSGEMVPDGQAPRRRLLLPAEADLCNALGLTEEEYWYFCDLTDSYNGKRAEEYELAGVPEVENGFLIPIVISLVVGIAVSAIGMLLAPKPRAPKEAEKSAGNLKTADQTGAKRFTTNSNFDSVQQLANLGETIPLVFANRRNGAGGIRVQTLLLWSQLLSYGTGQQLKVLLLLSAGEMAEAPEFEGYAIGDMTLRNYTSAKVGLYRRLNGGRIQEGDRYEAGTLEPNPFGDVFTVFDDASESYKQWFCGNRSTSTQAQFGLFAPMTNATAYKLQYELIMNPKDTDGKVKGDNNVKREKINREWRTLAGLVGDPNNPKYFIHGGAEDAEAFAPWGLTDVNSATESIRTQADDSLQAGALYMAGNAQVVCTGPDTPEPWALGVEKYYGFKIVEPGYIRTVDVNTELLNSYDPILQRLAIGTVANNRACHVTEIGLKSQVWKQITGFPNINSQPNAGVIADYENRNGTIQLGTIQKYVNRFSFFRLETRKLGTTEGWADISGGTIFCVRGNSPQDRYNYIRIIQPFGQQEYRFVPVPGFEAASSRKGQKVRLLVAGRLQRYSVGAFTVTYSGQPFVITSGTLTNGEWTIGSSPASGTGARQMSPASTPGARPTFRDWADVEERANLPPKNWREPRPKDMYFAVHGGTGLWDGRFVNTGGEYRKGNYIRNDVFGNMYHSIFRREMRTFDSPPVAKETVNFTVGSGYGSGGAVEVRQFSNGYLDWVIATPGTGYFNGDNATFSALGQTFVAQLLTNEDIALDGNLNPYDAVADIGRYDCERFSHEDNPEHTIVYVNEIVRQDGAVPQYENLALVGLRLNASKEWSSFSQLSAYVKRGVLVDRLIDDNGQPVTGLRGSTNNFAEIAYTLLTDPVLGAGKILGTTAVDRERMTLAARFCHANGFTWDGVIAEKQNLREFIFEQAAFCLLDFTILGGQFSLVPSVPYKDDFLIESAPKPVISALFTDGNVRNLKVSWLSPEERQLFKAVCKWRQETENGFSQERILTTRIADAFGGSDSDPEEFFDMSGFCTSQEQAQTFSQYALLLRKEIDHGLMFETTPSGAMGLEPGDYIRFVSEATHTSRFNNGSINSEGYITSTTTLADGEYNVLTWLPGTVGVGQSILGVKDGRALQPELFGQVFTLKTSATTSRVYKVESLSYTAEGFVELAGSSQPLTEDGTLTTALWNPSLFVAEAF